VSFVGRSLRVLRGPAPIYLAASILARLGSILLIPMYTRRLSPAEYGDFALGQSILTFLSIVFTLGLISAVPKFYYMDQDRDVGRAQAGSVALWLAVFTIGFAVLTCAGIAAFVKPGGSGVRYLLTCVTIAAAGSALSAVPDMFFRSEQRPYLAASYQLLQFGLQLAAGLFLVIYLGRGLRGAIEALALGYALTGLLALGFIVFYLRGKLSRRILMLALPFALPFLPHFLASWAQLAADRWTMKFFHLENTLGGYVLAVQLTSPIMMVVAAWNDAETARMGELYRSQGIGGIGAALSRIRRNYLLAATVPAVGIVAAIPVLTAVIGARFTSALYFIPIMAAFSVIETTYVPSSNVLYYASRTRTIAGVTMSAAILNVSLNLALIPFFGVTGALGARFITAIARSVVIWRAAQRCLSSAEPSSSGGGDTGEEGGAAVAIASKESA
jgi:O-antigen/teichoic acid export membrane protein